MIEKKERHIGKSLATITDQNKKNIYERKLKLG